MQFAIITAVTTAFSTTLSGLSVRQAGGFGSRMKQPCLVVDAPPKFDSLMHDLFSGSVNADAVAAACSSSIVWNDMSAKTPLDGIDAVRSMLNRKFPPGSRLTIERVSDGANSGGFTWHREADDLPAVVGLRGTLYAEMDDSGKITYVQEGAEPLFKPGEVTEAILKAATKNIQKDPPSEYARQTPTTAKGIVEYLWNEAYPAGAPPDEALRLFANEIVYEDFNYPKPFVGISAVEDFVRAFDIPGIEFVAERISEGERSVVFTWSVKINGQDGPAGISFYEVDASGKVCFIRDIPAPSIRPPPLASLAAKLRPKLRVFSPRVA